MGRSLDSLVTQFNCLHKSLLFSVSEHCSIQPETSKDCFFFLKGTYTLFFVCVCLCFLPRWDPLHMVGGPGQREALLLGGLRARHPEVCLWHRQELHWPQVWLQLRCRPQTMVSQPACRVKSSAGAQTICVVLINFPNVSVLHRL